MDFRAGCPVVLYGVCPADCEEPPYDVLGHSLGSGHDKPKFRAQAE